MDSPLKVLYMNRRLRLAAEPQTGRREVSALTDARKTLAYDFFRILRAPRPLRGRLLNRLGAYRLHPDAHPPNSNKPLFSINF